MKKWKMKKWNFKTLEYEEYTVPDNWKVKLFSNDKNEKINCAACGKPMIYGDGYTSRTIYSLCDIGYEVCKDCYDKERKEELAYENKSED